MQESSQKDVPVPSEYIADDMKRIFEIENMPPSEAKKSARKDYYFQDNKNAKSISTAVAAWAMATITATGVFFGFVDNPGALPLVPATALFSYYLADIFGAFTHKYFDSFAVEKPGPLGKAARQFRIHHEYAISLNDASYFNHVFGPSLVMMPFLATSAGFAAAGHLDPVLGTASLIFTMALMHSMEIHRQAHNFKPKAIAEFLQKHNLFLSNKQHSIHHSGDRDDNSQVVNGWSERPFKKLDLWNKLDRLYWKYMKRMPNNWVQEPSTIPPQVFEHLMENPHLISPDLKPMMETFAKRKDDRTDKLIEAREQWQADYIEQRRAMYLQLATHVGRSTAEALWIEEQDLQRNIFGHRPQPL